MEQENGREIPAQPLAAAGGGASAADVPAACGLSYFEQHLAPGLAGLAKLAERVGRGKAIGKQADLLNRMDTLRQLDDLSRYAADLSAQAAALKAELERFAVAVSEEDRDEWTRIFIESCRSFNRLVDGEYPLFRIFPIEVKADLANDGVYINNKLVRALHPRAVAGLVNGEIERLHKERFHLNQFVRALVRAYDALMAERRLAEGGKLVAAAVSLKQIHNLLAIRTGTAASGYPLAQFAFDIFRLRAQGGLEHDGRRLVFASTRNAREAVVIALPGGQKELLGSLELVEIDGGGEV